MSPLHTSQNHEPVVLVVALIEISLKNARIQKHIARSGELA